MTVSSTTSKVSYSGNGVTTVFAVPFYFLSNSHLSVVRRSVANIETTLVLGVDYTVTGAGVLTGGSVTMTSAPASGQTLTIFRNVPETQETDLLPNDRLPAESLEQSLDKLTMLTQQLDEGFSRSIKIPVSDTVGTATMLPTSSERASKFLAFDANGAPVPLTVSPTGDYVVEDEIQIATSGQTVFNLQKITYTPGISNLQVFVNGLNQVRGSAYVETNSTTVTFIQGLNAGAVVKFSRAKASTSTVADAASVVYLPSGSGAVQTNVRSKLRQFVSVYDFGAVGDGVTDDTTSIQNFFDYIQLNNVGTAYCSGNFAISSGLVIGRTGASLTKQIVGDARFVALNAIDTMLTVRACPELIWDGRVTVQGTGSTSYASRTCRVGVTIAGQGVSSNRMRFGGIIARNFNQFGINVQTLSTLTDLGNLRTSDCGSGYSVSTFLSANWSSKVDTGSSGSTSQLSTVTVDVLPPAQFTGSRNPNSFVIINGEPHIITAVDQVNSTISVFPWIDLNVTSGSLSYVFGGGVFTVGADSGILGIKQLDAVRCAIALNASALYGPIVDRFVTQFCGVGFSFGSAPAGANVTFQLNGFYCEGNIFDILRATRATVGGTVVSSYAVNFGKIAYVTDARLNTNLFNDSFNNMSSVVIYQNGVFNQYRQARQNRASSGSSLSLDVTRAPLNNQYKRDSWTINLVRPNFSNNDSFGYNGDTVTLVGTGTNFAPTGTITFVAPASTTVTTTGSGDIDRVELTVDDSTGILRFQDVSGTGIASGTVVVRVSGDVVILSKPLTATISNSSVTFSNTVATTVNGGADAKFNGFNGPAVFSVFYDFAADNFIVDTTSVGSFPSTTAANIANIANIFNTQSKYLGRGVWDTTNNRLMVATGSNANSPWYVADGSASVTPS